MKKTQNELPHLPLETARQQNDLETLPVWVLCPKCGRLAIYRASVVNINYIHAIHESTGVPIDVCIGKADGERR